MASEAQRRAVAKYDRDNVTRYAIKLNNNTDSDIIKAISESDNKQGYIKAALREYLARTQSPKD